MRSGFRMVAFCSLHWCQVEWGNGGHQERHVHVKDLLKEVSNITLTQWIFGPFSLILLQYYLYCGLYICDKIGLGS